MRLRTVLWYVSSCCVAVVANSSDLFCFFGRSKNVCQVLHDVELVVFGFACCIVFACETLLTLVVCWYCS